MNLVALLRLQQGDFRRKEMNKKQKKMLTRIIIAAVLVILHFIPITGIRDSSVIWRFIWKSDMIF